MGHSKEHILLRCEEESKEMSFFYNSDIVNYSGETRNCELYTEIVAEWLLKNLKKLDEIEAHVREKSYDCKHDGKLGRGEEDSEKNIAIKLFNQKIFDDDLVIIDYQTPLKNRRADKVGEIDLLAVNPNEKCVYIFELKKEESKETMLKCVLEGYTYLKTVCQNKLIEDFRLNSLYTIKAAPLVFEGKKQYVEYKDNRRIYLHRLMEKLDIIPFFLSKNDEGIFVIKKGLN